MVHKIQGIESQGGGVTEEQGIGVSEKGWGMGVWLVTGGYRAVLARGEKERSGSFMKEVEDRNVRYRRRMESLRGR